MTGDIPLGCTCGKVRGVARDVSASNGTRLLCYCRDCQAFAFFLERAGEILDQNGGTDVFQLAPSKVEINQGSDQLRCMRLKQGGLLRWSTACCRTPIGNTLATKQAPFVGIIHSFMDHEGHGVDREAALGPIRGASFTQYARGDTSGLDGHPKAGNAMLVRMIARLLLARIRGQHLPTPFFDSESSKPSVEPHVLSADELQHVVTARDAAR